ncbi:MAG: hypothetical protein QXR57_04475 [Metallosphaera sp.]|uniref:Uncharacterized protein n=2 Tax=Metallosphaera TaxID=41980 RepID=F4G3K1_METCR|nr:hypothetical protein [Metallosphaera cuprina]AEB95371.1 conserved hypothetical protein [Metallosphaera cuprina Ar-4]
MSYDERTTADDVRVEIHLNPFSFRETISRYRIESEDSWVKLVGKEGEYLAKEFDSYAVLVYPIYLIPTELIRSLSYRIPSIDRLREVLMKPYHWRDFVTFRVREGFIMSSDLELNVFLGMDLVNDVLVTTGLEFINLEDKLEIACRLQDFGSGSLDKAFRRISLGLSLYFELKRSQEDVALKLSREFLSKILSD